MNWLKSLREKRVTFNLLAASFDGLAMCADNRFLIREVKNLQSEISFLASFGYALSQDRSQLLAPAAFLVPQQRIIGGARPKAGGAAAASAGPPVAAAAAAAASAAPKATVVEPVAKSKK